MGGDAQEGRRTRAGTAEMKSGRERVLPARSSARVFVAPSGFSESLRLKNQVQL